jgi:hypothetical protein
MFTKPELKNFREDFQQAVKELETKYGVTIELGSISYTSNDFHAKMEVKKKVVEGIEGNVSHDQFEFEKYCFFVGLTKDFYGKQFSMHGKTFTISGINPKAHKMPVIATCTDGKSYKFAADDVKRLVK